RERGEVAGATAEVTLAAEVFERHRRAADELAARVRAIEEALGSQYDEVLQRISALEQQLERDEAERGRLAGERPGIERSIGGLEEQVARAEAERAAAEAHRTSPHHRFVTALRRGVAADAGVDTPADLDGVTAVLPVARDVAARIG